MKKLFLLLTCFLACLTMYGQTTVSKPVDVLWRSAEGYVYLMYSRQYDTYAIVMSTSNKYERSFSLFTGSFIEMCDKLDEIYGWLRLEKGTSVSIVDEPGISIHLTVCKNSMFITRDYTAGSLRLYGTHMLKMKERLLKHNN